jgi:hypothetical protein
MSPRFSCERRRFDRANVDPAAVELDASLLIAGYGCQDLKKPTDAASLRTGRVIRLPTNSDDHFIVTGAQGLC